MAFVKKKNRVLKVNEAAIGSYLSRGYDQVDEQGKVVKQATGGKTVTLTEFNKVAAKVDGLEAENKKLKKENDALKKEVKEAKEETADTAKENEEAPKTAAKESKK